MGRRRKPKFSNFKAADWDKYIKVKKGESTYTVDRKAPAEDKELFGVGVVPFGFSPSTATDADIHMTTTISRAGAKMAVSAIRGDQWDVLGIARDEDSVTTGPAGWYPAILTITLVGINDIGETETSQLSTRQYQKKKTRSGSMPFGRRSIATPNARTGAATAAIGDRDYEDCLNAIKAALNPTPTSPASSKILSKSAEPEIYVPVVSISTWLGELENIGTVTDF
ncbi:MAG: hypothetical protein F6K22_38750 [Okeania sp. SIO2F4]|uniref:hypothetical protein n=1 Tax=Okeania sp. SIO2F4 TaxID=2607790 RepID=UPI001428E2C7|nr:hypothetical protein [Okeania sp. SIO2F4]NES08195.1 hypothetical protein [Okeania sp. SIO2F4]